MAHASSNILGPKNVYIIGAQSSGKTTLTSALETYFDNKSDLTWKAVIVRKPHILREVARQVLQDHESTGQDVSGSKLRALELQTFILEAQHKIENAAKSSWFISDRSGVDAIVYGKCFAGESGVEKLLNTTAWKVLNTTAWKVLNTTAWKELEKTLRDSLIIVCEPVLTWLKEDGLRLMPKDPLARTELVFIIHRKFCDFLDDAKFQYTILPDTQHELNDRVSFVIEEWEKIGRAPTG
ncbi:hypothetical protein MMC12_008547 [Toensbergia leucococca]|nr:hypothetical protein [Toensbergia leucococca]